MAKSSSNDGTVKVIIAFDPTNPSRHDKTESLPAAEAHGLVAAGRARYADEEQQAALTNPETPTVLGQ